MKYAGERSNCKRSVNFSVLAPVPYTFRRFLAATMDRADPRRTKHVSRRGQELNVMKITISGILARRQGCGVAFSLLRYPKHRTPLDGRSPCSDQPLAPPHVASAD